MTVFKNIEIECDMPGCGARLQANDISASSLLHQGGWTTHRLGGDAKHACSACAKDHDASVRRYLIGQRALEKIA